MKYLIIDGFSINEEKGCCYISGRKLKNDFATTHGKEVDTIIVGLKVINPDDKILGRVLNVEWNKSGYLVNAVVE